MRVILSCALLETNCCEPFTICDCGAINALLGVFAFGCAVVPIRFHESAVKIPASLIRRRTVDAKVGACGGIYAIANVSGVAGILGTLGLFFDNFAYRASAFMDECGLD